MAAPRGGWQDRVTFAEDAAVSSGRSEEIVALDEAPVEKLRDRAEELASFGLAIDSFGHRAGPGYDPVTGLGSIDVPAFVYGIRFDALKPPFRLPRPRR